MSSYLTQENGYRLTLENNTGSLLLETDAPTPPPDEPRGGYLAIAPREHRQPPNSRFRSHATRITVTAPAAALRATLEPIVQTFTIQTTRAPLAAIFTPDAYQATTTYTRKRPDDLDERIRMIIITDQ